VDTTHVRAVRVRAELLEELVRVDVSCETGHGCILAVSDWMLYEIGQLNMLRVGRQIGVGYEMTSKKETWRQI